MKNCLLNLMKVKNPVPASVSASKGRAGGMGGSMYICQKKKIQLPYSCAFLSLLSTSEEC